MSTERRPRNRWLAMSILCLGALMIVLDVTIVNVALPSIRADLHFDDVSLAWVVNATMLIFGGFLLLGGRLGDLYGQRRVFLLGLGLFTLASLACGLTASGTFLVWTRGVQGLGGAVSVTLALLLAVYATINGNAAGWGSSSTLGLFAAAASVFALFLAIELRARKPLVPLAMFRRRNLSIAGVCAMLWSAAMFAWFFLSALYMQLVLGFTPMQVGIAFLPANLIMAVLSLGLSARLVMRFGVRRPLGVGLLLAAAGLALFARARLHGTLTIDILPGMALLGVGAGIGFNPMLMAAMSEVPQTEAGLASGIVNTAFLLGGSLGLALLASVAALHGAALTAAGAGRLEALAGGYRLAFAVSAGITVVAALLGGLGLRRVPSPSGALGH